MERWSWFLIKTWSLLKSLINLRLAAVVILLIRFSRCILTTGVSNFSSSPPQSLGDLFSGHNSETVSLWRLFQRFLAQKQSEDNYKGSEELCFQQWVARLCCQKLSTSSTSSRLRWVAAPKLPTLPIFGLVSTTLDLTTDVQEEIFGGLGFLPPGG